MICKKLKECVACELSGKRIENCENGRDECIQSSDCRETVNCGEKKSTTYQISNNGYHVISYRVDNGMIKVTKGEREEEKKCDFLVVFDKSGSYQKPTAIMVELKGRHIEHAFKQISNTMALFADFFRGCEAVYARIVASKVAPNFSARPEYIKLQKQMRAHGGNLKVLEKGLETIMKF